MIDLQPLVEAFIGNSKTAAQPSQQWQDLLMQQVDPNYQRKQRIRGALAAASQALASTPGDALSGLAAAAAAGGGAWNDMRNTQDSQKLQAMQLIEKSKMDQQAANLERMKDVIGIGNTANTAERQAANDAFDHEQRAKQTDLEGRRIDMMQPYYQSRTNYWDAKSEAAKDAKQTGIKPATPNTIAVTKRSIDNLVLRKESLLRQVAKDKFQDQSDPAVEQDIQSKVQEYQRNLFIQNNIDPDTFEYIGQGASPAGIPSDVTGKTDLPTPSDPLAQAREAIARGAPRDAVIARLQKMGIDPSGL